MARSERMGSQQEQGPGENAGSPRAGCRPARPACSPVPCLGPGLSPAGAGPPRAVAAASAARVMASASGSAGRAGPGDADVSWAPAAARSAAACVELKARGWAMAGPLAIGAAGASDDRVPRVSQRARAAAGSEGRRARGAEVIAGAGSDGRINRRRAIAAAGSVSRLLIEPARINSMCGGGPVQGGRRDHTHVHIIAYDSRRRPSLLRT
jgi:hypothetical protein